MLTLRRSTAGSEWIPYVTLVTGAGSPMVDHSALSIDATKTGTGINTFQVLTGPVGWTLRVGSALRSAGHIGISKVLRNTLAGGSSASG